MKKIDEDLAGKKMGSIWATGENYDDYQAISPLEKDPKYKVIVNVFNTYYSTPNIRWRFDREFTTDSSFEKSKNELLFSKLFYEQQDGFKVKKVSDNNENKPGSFENPIPNIKLDFIDYLYLSNTKNIMMQSVQYRLLVAYLEFMEFMLASTKGIKGEGVYDNTLSLKDIFIKNYEIINKYEQALLDYLKLDYIMGLTLDDKLLMFPGNSAQEREFDFRDTYKWALKQYEYVVSPIKFTMGGTEWERTKKNFYGAFDKNEARMPYYRVAWKNIELVDEVKRPTLIDNSLEANERMRNVIFSFEPFGWTFKK
ncbi:hypothetical protein KQ878_00845 [Mycoplasma zalophidermidis]|uniref:Uncharacterized protein n=1 Tax=Mycoplasma zalophidermidis TaxID=398174 RepID=A0ABS6DR07_9MOLU|nr:hypothetical protein [Mycoplasma zalophidermidis]MBU4693433.1 hypothetical protein [Mycoplasma zalophidermidis]